MAEVTVNIQGEDINKMIAAAILESTLGNAIDETVKTLVTEFGKRDYYGDGQVTSVIRDLIRQETRRIVETEYGDTIREEIRKEIDKQLAANDNLVGTVISNMLNGRYKD